MAEIGPIEELELLYTTNLIYNNEAKAMAVTHANANALAVAVTHANANANNYDKCSWYNLLITRVSTFVPPLVPPSVSPKYGANSFVFIFSLFTHVIELLYDLAVQLMAMAMSVVIFLVSGGKVKINMANKNFLTL
jgi:hypothetical protein